MPWPLEDEMSVGAALRAVACVVLAAACVSCTAEGTRGPQILFAPAMASPSGTDQWTIVVQGRVWEFPEDSRRRQLLIDVLARAVGADRSDPLFRSRAGHLVSDSIGDASISIVLGDRQVRLLPSDAAGSFATPVTLTSEQVARLSHDGVIPFESLPTPQLPGRFTGSARLVGAQGVTVVTDIDDTIKDTNVNDHAEARANTLMRPFRAVAGMPELYRAWQAAAGPGLHFHVVSAGPWQFHEPLRRFTEEERFPTFTWDMRSVDTTEPATLLRETVNADPQRL
ncbi:MAG TPA: phosphatase domain-containing protein, partial [Albitalea sp.]|nr:phosphatase domain-containing protein [Albitalea sp.]